MITRRKIRCSSYGKHESQHDTSVDPSAHRHGKSFKKICPFIISIRWSKRTMDYGIPPGNLKLHNHKPHMNPSIKPHKRVPSEISAYITSLLKENDTIDRRSILAVLKTTFPDHEVDARQISNIKNRFTDKAKKQMQTAGGDFGQLLQYIKAEDSRTGGWHWEFLMDENGVARRIWFMTPECYQLAQVFSDVLFNDIAQNRNSFKLPLNLYMGIDGEHHGRAIAISILDNETTDAHRWSLAQLFKRLPPNINRAIITDWDPALEAALRDYQAEGVWHGLCIWHIWGNIEKKLKRVLGRDWEKFSAAFWKLYHSVSPRLFEDRWLPFLEEFPDAAEYLSANLWSERHRWAWPYVMSRFTAGTRTQGIVESENRINKQMGGPKTPLTTLVKRIVERIQNQAKEQLERAQKFVRTAFLLGLD